MTRFSCDPAPLRLEVAPAIGERRVPRKTGVAGIRAGRPLEPASALTLWSGLVLL